MLNPAELAAQQSRIQGNQVLPIAAFPTRATQVRRVQYAPKWSTARIPAQNSQTIVFFRTTNAVDRVSNLKLAGQQSTKEGDIVHRLMPMLWFGTGEADQIAVIEPGILEFQVLNNQAYQLLLRSIMPGVGFTGNTSVANLGWPSPRESTAIGQVPLGPGDTFSLSERWPGAITSQNAVIETIQLENMTDIPIS